MILIMLSLKNKYDTYYHTKMKYCKIIFIYNLCTYNI